MTTAVLPKHTHTHTQQYQKMQPTVGSENPDAPSSEEENVCNFRVYFMTSVRWNDHHSARNSVVGCY